MKTARRMMLGLLAASALPRSWALPPKALRFPRDFGSHPDMQTEWWYVTGHVRAQGRSYGFQLTFFRSRVASTQNLRSAFAARQLLFAQAQTAATATNMRARPTLAPSLTLPAWKPAPPATTLIRSTPAKQKMRIPTSARLAIPT